MTPSAKQLVIENCAGNGDIFLAECPGQTTLRWGNFLERLQRPLDPSEHIKPIDPSHFETLRQLVTQPQSAYFGPLGFFHDGQQLSTTTQLELTTDVTRIQLQANADVTPDVSHISMAAIHRSAFESLRGELCPRFDAMFDFAAHPIPTHQGSAVESIEQLVGEFYHMLPERSQLDFMLRLAVLLHELPFENFSKIIAGISMRSGYEMISNAALGFGGVCAEKTNLLQFLCDVLGIETQPVIGCADRVPDDYHDQLERFLTAPQDTPPPLWAQHYLLEVRLQKQWYLIDATGGNLPLTFLNRDDSEPFFGAGMRARMVYRVERLKLGRVARQTGDMLCLLSQFHVPDLHLQYVFEQGLGLHIGNGLYLGVYYDWGAERAMVMENYYASQAMRNGFAQPRFLHEQNFHSLPDPRLVELMRQALESLRNLYLQSRPHYTGDFTFVLQPLRDTFWRRPRLSEGVSM